MMDFEDRLERIDRQECFRDELTCDLGGLVGAAGSIASGIMGSSAATNAANAQTTAAQNAQNTLGAANSTVQQGYQPYTAAGTSAINSLTSNMQNGTGFAQPFNMSSFMSDPGYQFTLQQGDNAINASAASKGGALSGGTLKALSGYASGLANQTYGDAYNRYLQTSQQNYNQTAGIAQLGLGAQQQSAQSTLGTAQGQANLQTQAGNAQAAGYIGQQNAINGAITGVGSAANQYSFNNGIRANPITLLGQNL